MVKPMRIEIPDQDIKDLRQQLKQTRWPPLISGSNWEDGTDGEYLRDLITYWASQYDWRWFTNSAAVSTRLYREAQPVTL